MLLAIKAESGTRGRDVFLYSYFKEWLTPIQAAAVVEKKPGYRFENVGSCKGFLIRRDHIRATFLEAMEAPSQDTMELALTIFDRYGCVKKELLEHPVRRGTGVWKDELSNGDFLLIEEVTVLKPYRRTGIGKKLFKAVLKEASKLNSDIKYVFAYPTCLNTGNELKERDGKEPRERVMISAAQANAARLFFWNLGFRRVGLTSWFAFAIDFNHLSRSTAVRDDLEYTQLEIPDADNIEEDDPEPDMQKHHLILPPATFDAEGNIIPVDDMSSASAYVNQRLATKNAHRERKYPCHNWTKTLPDDQCLERLKDLAKEIGMEDKRWTARDNYGRTILHTAACNHLPLSTAWLLSSLGDKLKQERDKEGYSPLESLVSELGEARLGESKGDRFKVTVEEFDGYDEKAISCLLILHELPLNNPQLRQRYRFGCSCGQCIGGFLSPRMMRKLQFQSTRISRHLEKDLDNDGQAWYHRHELYLRYVPKQIRVKFPRVTKLRQGFHSFLVLIDICLDQGIVPHVDHLMAAHKKTKLWRQMHTFYFSQGGDIGAAMSLVIEMARSLDPKAGSGPAETNKTVADLPECRNDHEFELVEWLCVPSSRQKYQESGKDRLIKPWKAQILQRSGSLNTFDREALEFGLYASLIMQYGLRP